ncbi:MAG: GDP-mannose 4,6-dehydratase [Rhodobacteraceae bacterium]|nr:GDP-mannose 4,6-dehydratase [Paracoccaceae bacterium]
MAASKNPGTVLILGVTGQDGALLAAQLLSAGWKVLGGFRRGHASKLWRLEELGVLERITLVNLNLHEPHQLVELLAAHRPDAIYHLAGESFVADSFQQPRSIIETNALGTLNVLEAIRLSVPDAALFFASSAEIYGAPRDNTPLDENSPYRPTNPYGLSKLTAQHLVAIYREQHGLRAVNGILFNHESPYRARNFVTRKITYNLARLHVDGGAPMQLGDLSSGRDWGSAIDYAAAMPMTLATSPPQDYVFATGRATTVKAFLTMAAEAAGFDPHFDGEGIATTCRDRKSGLMLATVAPQYFRKFDTPPLIGNPAHLKLAVGFKGSREIVAIATEMVQADIDRRKRGAVNV